ncbi:hypothetical protein JVT61DRAFT_12784 [Boletus reticuloceps]|uniref:CcmS related domain-containing protein n=1 Tax=Boletus reticuloceps TaxID=495285 RepID=A0A8I2YX61_9AGAM|nr:hypothetical protein JVT61DRAFT_12784 [Boletus reticuloceps]
MARRWSSSDGWATDKAGNSDEGWETGVTQAPMPPPQQNKFGGGRDHAKSHYAQQRLQIPSSNHQTGANASAHRTSSTGWGHPNPQDAWGHESDEESGDQGDQADEDDAWQANDGWDDANSGWGRQSHSAAWNHAVSAHSARPRATSRSHAPTSGWQTWGEEAQRLPKVTFDPAIPSSSSSAGSKPVLSPLQRAQILNALLNNSQQNQQPYAMPPNAGASFSPAAANNWQQHQSSQRGNGHQGQQPESHQFHEWHHGHESEHKNRSNVQHQDTESRPRKLSKRDKKRQEEVHDVWGLGDGWNDMQDEEDQQDTTQDAWGRKVHFTPSALRASMLPSAPSVAPSTVVENFTVNALPQNKLGLSTIPMSKTLSYAYSGTTPSTESEPGRAAMERITDFQFVESRGEALESVQRAFYNKQRKAADRFHWLFPPDKDERVSSLVNWISSMSFGIASFGLQKFLQTRERGALIVNAAYRPVHSPSEPAFDWVTWNQIQRTMDRILQESVGYYNPAMHVIVFVLLPSPSGNSVAIWRRKLPIPNNIRLAYQAQITQAMAALRKEYPVLVDELPPPPEPTPPSLPKKKKRKWYKLWLSS